MATGKLETERKYEAASVVASLPSFSDLRHVTAESSEEDQALDAEYYDTPDMRLLRVGITLRRRHGGSDAGWHLKLPVGPHTRREVHHPIGEPGSVVPEELSRLVVAYTRGAPLGPVAHITTARHRRVLRGGDGAELAEVVLDDVSAQTMGQATTISRWQEAEIELASGDRRLLKEAGERLREAGFRPAGYAAKLERAMAGRFPAPSDGAGRLSDAETGRGAQSDPSAKPERGTAQSRHGSWTKHGDRAGGWPSGQPTAAELVLAYLRDQAATAAALDVAVRLGEPDSVHQMRISVRRVRAVLQSFPEVLPRPRTDHLIAELRWLGRELGEARDIEVLAGRFRAALRQVPAELMLGPVQARVQAHFGPLRGQAQRSLVEALDSARYLALLDELDRLLDDPPVTGAGELPASDELPKAVGRAYRRVKRLMRRARGAPNGDQRDTTLHAARKAAKRARYAAEVLRPIRRKKAERFAERMRSVQSVLGDFQDAVIARRAARDLGARAFLAGENGFTFGLLYERDDAAARQLRAKAGRVWKRAAAAKHRRWLR